MILGFGPLLSLLLAILACLKSCVYARVPRAAMEAGGCRGLNLNSKLAVSVPGQFPEKLLDVISTPSLVVK